MAWQNKFFSLERDIGATAANMEMFELDVTPQVEQLAATANANRVVLYTLSADGGRSTISPAERTMDRQSGAVRGGGLAWNNQVESVDATNRQSGMQLMAHATGGLAALRGGQFNRMFDRVPPGTSTPTTRWGIATLGSRMAKSTRSPSS